MRLLSSASAGMAGCDCTYDSWLLIPTFVDVAWEQCLAIRGLKMRKRRAEFLPLGPIHLANQVMRIRGTSF